MNMVILHVSFTSTDAAFIRVLNAAGIRGSFSSMVVKRNDSNDIVARVVCLTIPLMPSFDDVVLAAYEHHLTTNGPRGIRDTMWCICDAPGHIENMDTVGRLASLIQAYAFEYGKTWRDATRFVDGMYDFVHEKRIVDESHWNALFILLRHMEEDDDAYEVVMELLPLIRDVTHSSRPAFWSSPKTQIQVLELCIHLNDDSILCIRR